MQNFNNVPLLKIEKHVFKLSCKLYMIAFSESIVNKLSEKIHFNAINSCFNLDSFVPLSVELALYNDLSTSLHRKSLIT
jgi:hypothetical protein